MSRAIRKLAQRTRLTPAALAQFLRAHDFPIVEENTATFVFLGEADEVRLRHWIHGLPGAYPLKRLLDSDLWYHVLDLPEGSRVEYKFEVVRNGETRLLLDPLNPHHARDPFGANSVCEGPGYSVPDWVRQDAEAREGSVETHRLKSEALRDVRTVHVYLPARFRKRRRYPLLVVHDGEDYLNYASLRAVLDNLIHRLEIPPLIAALTVPHDRLREYAADRAHSTFLARELLPWAARHYPLLDDAGSRCVMGASFGAVASLAAALHHPGTFGSLLLQSGSFAFSDIGKHWRGPAFEPVVRFVNAFRERPKKPAERAFLSCGTYESLIYENRSMVPVFQGTGMDVKYVEARDGHNWENWRDRLREGLSWLFPGPLWMVYE